MFRCRLTLDKHNVADIQRRFHIECKLKSIGCDLLDDQENAVLFVVNGD
jgi:hypothetical protein